MVRWYGVNFQCRGDILILKCVKQGPTVLTVGAVGEGLFGHFYPPTERFGGYSVGWLCLV